MYQYRAEILRLLGVDTPEMTGDTKEAGALAKATTTRYMEMTDCKVTVTTSHKDSFGRWLAVITDNAGRDLGSHLIELGHGK